MRRTLSLIFGVALAGLLAVGVVAGTIVGTPRNDTLRGSPKADRLDGKAGNDKLYGLGGRDVLIGGLGKDLLVGGGGRDTLNCGPGIDTAQADALDEVKASCEFVKGLPKPPAPPPPPPSPPAPPTPPPPPPPSVNVTPGSYQGVTNEGAFVFFEVLGDRTIRGFRVNNLIQRCGPRLPGTSGTLAGPADVGPQPYPIGADGRFSISVSWTGRIEDDENAKTSFTVDGGFSAATTAGTLLLTSQYTDEGITVTCSTRSATWTAALVP